MTQSLTRILYDDVVKLRDFVRNVLISDAVREGSHRVVNVKKSFCEELMQPGVLSNVAELHEPMAPQAQVGILPGPRADQWHSVIRSAFPHDFRFRATH